MAGLRLTIKRADGSIYWIENFNDEGECDRWLAEEKRRTYWRSDFTTVKDPIPDPVEPPEVKAAREARQALRRELAALTAADVNTAAKAGAVLLKIVEALGLKD